MTKSNKYIVRVTIEKEIEVELMPEFFGEMTEDEYLAEFRKGLWSVDSIDDIVKYAARMAATDGSGIYDGIGYLTNSVAVTKQKPDVKFRELSEEVDEEILSKTPANTAQAAPKGIAE